MNPPGRNLFATIEVTLRDSSGTSIQSFKMESGITDSEIQAELKRGDLTPMWLHFSTIYSSYRKLERELTEARWRGPSIVRPLNDYRYTYSLNHLLHISSLLETLVKRLESLKQKLTPTDGSELRITSPELRQVDFLLALMTLELVEIYKML